MVLYIYHIEYSQNTTCTTTSRIRNYNVSIDSQCSLSNGILLYLANDHLLFTYIIFFVSEHSVKDSLSVTEQSTSQQQLGSQPFTTKSHMQPANKIT